MCPGKIGPPRERASAPRAGVDTRRRAWVCWRVARTVVGGTQIQGNPMVTEVDIRKALRQVKDPELKLDLVVLGLIYDIQIDGGRVGVTMSLTSPMCPVAGELLDKAREAVESVPGVESAEVELTFSPPWSADRINPTIRAALGL